METKDWEAVSCVSCMGRVVRSENKEGVSLVRSQSGRTDNTVWQYWCIRKSSKLCIKMQRWISMDVKYYRMAVYPINVTTLYIKQFSALKELIAYYHKLYRYKNHSKNTNFYEI